MTEEQGSVDIRLDVQEIGSQGFAEVPFTIANNTPDIVVPHTFLIRHDAPSLVVLSQPGWRIRVNACELLTTFIGPGEQSQDSITVKWLFGDWTEARPLRVVGRLTYERVKLDEFRRHVLKPVAARRHTGAEQEPKLRDGYWLARNAPQQAFTRKWVPIGPNRVPGPWHIIPGQPELDIYWWACSTSIRAWAVKGPTFCWVLPNLAGDAIDLAMQTDLSTFDYLDGIGVALGGAPGDSGVANTHSAGAPHNRDWLEIAEPLTPNHFWYDTWQARGVRDRWSDPIYSPPPRSLGVILAGRERIKKDVRRFSRATEEVITLARASLEAGTSLEAVWSETQDKIIDAQARLLRRNHVRTQYGDDRGWMGHHCLTSARRRLAEAANALGIEEAKIDEERCSREMGKALGVRDEADAVEEVPAEIKGALDRDTGQLRESFREMILQGRDSIDRGRPPDSVWPAVEDTMIRRFHELARTHHLGKQKWAERYRREFERIIFRVAYYDRFDDILGDGD